MFDLHTCSSCRFFQPEGHYHGSCARLHSAVMGEWPVCRLAKSAFSGGEEPMTRSEASSMREILEQLSAKKLVETKVSIAC